jgi:CelD/BcsL family acetyltransferase involved in cellulose biosynthesis
MVFPRNSKWPGLLGEIWMTGNGVALQIHQSPSDLVNLEKDWEKLLERSSTNTIFQTWVWNRLWWKHFGRSRDLLLLTVRESGGKLLGIAPLFYTPDGDNQRTLQFVGGTDLSDYLDFIVARGSEASFYSAIADFLGSSPDLWDVLDLHCLPAESPTLKIFRKLCDQKGFRETLTIEDVCPRVELPSSWNEFLSGMSQKERHEIRRKIKKIQRESEEYRYIAIDSASFPEGIQSFLELHQKSDTQKMAFMNPERKRFFREMAWTLLQKGWLEILFLEADHNRLASLLNFRYRDTVYAYNSGYDPEFGRWSPGWVLISHSIQDAIQGGVKVYDFMRGNESYKYRFSARDKEIYNHVIQRREENPN